MVKLSQINIFYSSNQKSFCFFVLGVATVINLDRGCTVSFFRSHYKILWFLGSWNVINYSW